MRAITTLLEGRDRRLAHCTVVANDAGQALIPGAGMGRAAATFIAPSPAHRSRTLWNHEGNRVDLATGRGHSARPSPHLALGSHGHGDDRGPEPLQKISR